MARPRPALRLLLAQCLAVTALAQTAVYMVDVPDVICPGGARRVTIRLWPASNGSDVAGTPHILTFFRTGLTTTSVTFKLVAAANPSQEAIGNMTVNLQDVTSMRRRLISEGQEVDPKGRQQQEEEAMNCEEFFLLDGRDPVEVPDTWEEAREAFRGICEEGGGASNCSAAEARIFAGYPDSEDPMDADDRLCLRLLAHASKLDSDGWLTYRRLKGGYSGRGGSPFSGRVVTSRATVYGYSNDQLSANYPRGYASSSYGYTGRAAIPLVFVMPYGYGTFAGSRYRTKCYDGSGQQCNSGRVSCSGGKSCALSIPSGEQQARDDLADLGFVPSDYGNALDLIITSVVGSAYTPSRICGDVSSGWVPPMGQDLFVALTPMSTLDYDDDDDDTPPEYWVPPFVIGVVLVCCGPLACYYGRKWWKQRKLRKEFDEMGKTRRREIGDNRQWAVPQMYMLEGSYTVGNKQSAFVVCSLQVEDNGSFLGTLTQDGRDWSVEGRLWMYSRYQQGTMKFRATKSDYVNEEVLEAAGMIDIMSPSHLGGLDQVSLETIHGFGNNNGVPKKFKRGHFFIHAKGWRDESPAVPLYVEAHTVDSAGDGQKLVMGSNADLPGAIYDAPEEPTPVVIGMPLQNLASTEARTLPQPAVVSPLPNLAGQKLESEEARSLPQPAVVSPLPNLAGQTLDKEEASEAFLHVRSEGSANGGAEEEPARHNDQGATKSAGAAGAYQVFQDEDEEEADKAAPPQDNEATLVADPVMSEHADSGVAGILKEGQELLHGEADADVGGAADGEADADVGGVEDAEVDADVGGVEDVEAPRDTE